MGWLLSLWFTGRSGIGYQPRYWSRIALLAELKGVSRAGSPVPALARRIAEERLEQAVAKAWDKDLGASPAEYLDSLRGLDEVIDALAAGRVTSWSINLLSMSSRSTFSTMEDDYDPPNSPPTAEGDINNYVLHDTLGQCASVLANDSDYDGPQELTAIKKSDPARGTLSLNSDGTFTYLPTPNLEYYDSFTYAAFDGADESNAETVWVTVTNEYPVEGDDPEGDPYGYPVAYGEELVVESLRYNDFDPDGEPDNSQFDLHILTQPTKGMLHPLPIPAVEVLGLREVGVAAEADPAETGLAAQGDRAVEVPGGLFMAGAVAAAVDHVQQFTRVGQRDHQGS